MEGRFRRVMEGMWDDLAIIDQPFELPDVEFLERTGIQLWQGDPWTGAPNELVIVADPSRLIPSVPMDSRGAPA